jgi:1,4-alpha-glucan branching enzyme
LLGEQDVYLFREGTHGALYRVLGCVLDKRGATFSVWAPNASRVAVIGSFNDWSPTAHPLTARSDSSGLWEGKVPGVRRGDSYKFHIVSANGRYAVD